MINNRPYRIGDTEEILVIRPEANFDRACDEAYRRAVTAFGIDEDGHSSKVEGWDRSSCAIRIDFVSYRGFGSSHIGATENGE